MKVSDYIAKYLEHRGVKCVFELPGGMTAHILDSILQKTQMRIVSMHHEQAAAFAADACGRMTGIPGVAMATSGPGALNLLTGIGSCHFDSSPGIFITGQVNTYELKRDKKIRQQGFQETDIVSMAQHITKRSYAVERAEDIPAILEEAFAIAMEGRPGPVLIDIPMDVQRGEIDAELPTQPKATPTTVLPKDWHKELDALSASLKKFKRPMILVGRGLKASFSDAALQTFLAITKAPVVTTLLAIDALPFAHPQRVGFIGTYGNRWANIAFGECDLLIVIGSRLDIRQTGADTDFFEHREIYHIDCEVAEINNRVKGCVPIVCDVKDFLTAFNNTYAHEQYPLPTDWLQYIQALKEKWPDTAELKTQGINPNRFMHVLSQNNKDTAAYISDVGAHQMWAAQSIELEEGQPFLTSGGMGAMGYALPAAIGACLSAEGKPVTVIAGDGSMQLNIQELQTIVRNELPIKMIVLNNNCLAMIRQFQDTYFGSRYQSTWWGYSAPDFEKVAMAYGVEGKTIHTEEEIAAAVQWMWTGENRNKPQLLQVMIDPGTNTYPKIAFGKPITEMEPFAEPVGMRK